MQITFNLQIASINVELCMESNNMIDRAFREIVKRQEILKMMSIDFYYSYMQKRLVSAYFTLEEAGIVSGDKLIAVCNGKVLNGKHI